METRIVFIWDCTIKNLFLEFILPDDSLSFVLSLEWYKRITSNNEAIYDSIAIAFTILPFHDDENGNRATSLKPLHVSNVLSLSLSFIRSCVRNNVRCLLGRYSWNKERGTMKRGRPGVSQRQNERVSE